MSFGLKTWGAGGQVQTDTTTFTYQILQRNTVDFTDLGGADSYTISAPGLNTANGGVIAIPLNLFNPSFPGIGANAMPHLTVANGSFTVSRIHPGASGANDMRSRLVVLYLVVKYK